MTLDAKWVWTDTAVGTLPLDDLRRAFIMGAQWWEFQREKCAMFASDALVVEQAAEEYFPGGKLPEKSDEFELKFCEKCVQMTNHIGMVCQKCRTDELELRYCEKCVTITRHLDNVCQKCGTDWGIR